MSRTSHPRKPKGIISVTDRQRAAVRQLNEGTATRAELMAMYGISRQVLWQWTMLVKEADDDAANLEAVR